MTWSETKRLTSVTIYYKKKSLNSIKEKKDINIINIVCIKNWRNVILKRILKKVSTIYKLLCLMMLFNCVENLKGKEKRISKFKKNLWVAI